jgi:hypothetical protein
VEVVVERLVHGGAVAAWMVKRERRGLLGHGSSESDTKLLDNLVELEEEEEGLEKNREEQKWQGRTEE